MTLSAMHARDVGWICCDRIMPRVGNSPVAGSRRNSEAPVVKKCQVMADRLEAYVWVGYCKRCCDSVIVFLSVLTCLKYSKDSPQKILVALHQLSCLFDSKYIA